MFNTTEQNIKGNNNIVSNGNLNLQMIVNNECHINIYEYDIVKVIKLFNDNVDLLTDNTSIKNIGDEKYDFIEKEKKNNINNLSNEYFELLKDEFLPYFYKIDSFLKSPQNKNIKNMYERVSLRLKSTIIAYREKYNKFEEIISDISNTVSKKIDGEEELDPLLVLVFLNYMYWNCDIGKKK